MRPQRRLFRNRLETRTNFFLRSFWICWGEFVIGFAIGCALIAGIFLPL